MSEREKDFKKVEPEMNHSRESGSGATVQNVTGPVLLSRRGGGPRTAHGKERSKHNARKHGIFSKAVLLQYESRSEYTALLNGLHDDFQPLGALEEALVETLAVTRWRQRRLLIAEAAEIEAERKFLEWEEEDRQLAEADKIPPFSDERGLIGKINNAEVLDACLIWLSRLKVGIDSSGLDLPQAPRVLQLLYGDFSERYWRVNPLLAYHFKTTALLASEDLRTKFQVSPEKCKADFVEVLDKEIERLVMYKLEREERGPIRRDLDRRRRNVPDSRRLDQLLRYSANLERTFDRTLSQLERAQRMRLGQPVPPRIDVNVSSS